MQSNTLNDNSQKCRWMLSRSVCWHVCSGLFCATVGVWALVLCNGPKNPPHNNKKKIKIKSSVYIFLCSTWASTVCFEPSYHGWIYHSCYRAKACPHYGYHRSGWILFGWTFVDKGLPSSRHHSSIVILQYFAHWSYLSRSSWSESTYWSSYLSSALTFEIRRRARTFSCTMVTFLILRICFTSCRPSDLMKSTILVQCPTLL